MNEQWQALPFDRMVSLMDIADSNTIFIPGGTSGIGLALAQRLQALGNTVIIGGRRAEVLDRLRDEHGFDSVVLDTTDADSIRRAAATVIAAHPAMNAVLLSAGIMEPEDYRNADGFLDVAERTVATNLLGPIRLIAAFTEQLQAQRTAAIYTVSSGLAFVPLGLTPTYNATKAAIHMLSEGMRLQFAGTGVQVTEIIPPAVRTPLMGQEDRETAMPLDEFADEVIDLLRTRPDAREIAVERVDFQRGAVARGDYDQVVSVINGLAR